MNNKRSLEQQESDRLLKVLKDAPVPLCSGLPSLEPFSSAPVTAAPTPYQAPPSPKPAVLQATPAGTLRPAEHSATLLAADSAKSRASVKGASADPAFYKNACGYSAIENHDLEARRNRRECP